MLRAVLLLLLFASFATADANVCVNEVCASSGPAPEEPPQAAPGPVAEATPQAAPHAAAYEERPFADSRQSPPAEAAAPVVATPPVSWSTLLMALAVASVSQARLIWHASKGGILAVSGLFGLALFSRIDGPQVLQHPTRAAIVDLVAREPGIHVEELRRRLEISTSTALHHLRRLQATGVLVVSRADGLRRYYQAATPLGRARDDVTLLRQPTRQRIAQLVAGSPGISQTDIVTRVGIGKAGACKHLKALEAAGMVEGRPDGRLRRYRPTEQLGSMLRLVGSTETSQGLRSTTGWSSAQPLPMAAVTA